jgi:hypothetical protein
MYIGGIMSRKTTPVSIRDHRFHTAYGHILVHKFNAFVNNEPFHEDPPSNRCITSYNVRHLDTVEKLRDALHTYAYEGLKAAEEDHEENIKLYVSVFKASAVIGIGALFGAFGNLSHVVLGVCGISSLWTLFASGYSALLLDDAIKEFRRLADEVNEVYLQWKEKNKVS